MRATAPTLNTPVESAKITLNDSGIYHLCEEFTFATVKPVINWIMEENIQRNKKAYLTLMISSYGGDLHSAFALVDMMRGSAIPVRTVGLGVIASAGLATFISGEKGHRVLTPNTAILSHQWSWGSFGKEHELVAGMRKFELTTDRMMTLYRRSTGLSEKIIRTSLLPPEDVWLSAEEALKLKLCDKIKDV